jgi:adenine-specific DNA methylase
LRRKKKIKHKAMASKVYDALIPFLGNKRRLLDDISPHFKGHVLLDIFMGSGAVSLCAKAGGMQIIANDIASRSKIIGEAIIKNQNIKISEEDVASLFIPTENSGFVEKNFVPDVFLPETARMLDNALAQARKYESPKKELLLCTLEKFILGGRQFGGFQVGKKDNEMVMQGKFVELIEGVSSEARADKIVASLMPAFTQLLAVRKKINRAIFNNAQGDENEVYQMDCFDLLEKLKNENRKIDILYADSPYFNSTVYSSHYKILDEILEEKRGIEIKDKAFNTKDVLENFEKLFTLSEFIPKWVISMGYNPASDAGIKGEELLTVVQRFREADLYFLEHAWAINNIASKNGKRQSENVEYLIVTK